MRVITAPGVEIKEIDKSQYSPAMTGTTCYIAGFANKGEAYQPMEFTTRAAWTNYYGEPDNEAEKYFYNACIEVLNQNGRLYCARLPYDNESFEKLVGYKYNVNTMQDTSVLTSDLQLSTVIDCISAVDKTINKVAVINGAQEPTTYSQSEVDEYRTDEKKVANDTILIVDKTCATYKKIPEDHRKGQDREMIGILPVITTAANALYAQSLINVEPQNAKYFEVIGECKTLYSENTISSGYVNDKDEFVYAINHDLVKQLNSAYKNYKQAYASIESILDTLGDFKTAIDSLNKQLNTSLTAVSDTNIGNETLATKVSEFNDLLNDNLIFSDVKDQLSISIDDDSEDTIGDFRENVLETEAIYNNRMTWNAEDGDNALPETVSFDANEYFSTIEYDSTLSSFKREHLKDIGVIVFKMYVDSAEGNKIAFEPVEAFCGSLQKDEKDQNTGASKFIDRIVNNSSNYIYLFSNCYNTKTAKNNYYNSLDIHIAKPLGITGILGFYEEQTVENISIDKSIYDGLNKSFEKVSDINERDIDIVCDAGISNIASFIKAVYEKSGKYNLTELASDGETPLIASWKCDSNNAAIKTWKTVVQKYDTFCKKTRKDCMFITECPRPLVISGQKKIIRSSKPTNTIDANILPYIKFVTGLNTNYGAGYIDWFEIADEFSGDLFWLPPSIKAMGVYINTDVNFNYWDAPAGLNRGVISATDVAFSPNAKQAGSIYEKNWNYAINYPSDGIVLEGQKTFQVAASAFDRVNVRRLFLRLERQAYKVARYFVYEGNTAYTRQRLVDAIDPYMKAAKIGGGIYDYKIICDETTNTPEVIDRNELKVKIGIKPTKTAEFILIDFIALTTGGSFEEAMQ